MPERLTNDLIDTSQRQALLKALTVFSMLTPKQSAELADLMYEVKYDANEDIATFRKAAG